jgi:hypothetical protein
MEGAGGDESYAAVAAELEYPSQLGTSHLGRQSWATWWSKETKYETKASAEVEGNECYRDLHGAPEAH